MRNVLASVLAVVVLLVGNGKAGAEIRFSPATPLPAPVNVPGYRCGGSSISADELSLFFHSTRPGGEGDVDLWLTTRATTADSWISPVNLGISVNTPYFEETPSISADGLTLFFSDGGGRPRPGGYGPASIWMTTRTDPSDPFGFGPPVPLDPPVNSSSYETNPHISADDLSLFFSSYRSGNWHLSVTTRASKSDLWQPPIDLGPTVNSSAHDTTPRISSDGRTLLFTSDRPSGSGPSDIWMTQREDPSDPLGFGPPVPLGPEVNSALFTEGPGDVSPDFPAIGSTLYFWRNDTGVYQIYQATVIPEPSTLALLGMGTLALLAYAWQKRRRR